MDNFTPDVRKPNLSALQRNPGFPSRLANHLVMIYYYYLVALEDSKELQLSLQTQIRLVPIHSSAFLSKR